MKRSQLGIAFCLFLLFAGCGPSPEQQTRMTATAMTAIAAAWTPTTTPTLTETPAPTSTATQTPNPTETPTLTQTPNPGQYSAPDHSFSLIAPAGWQPSDYGMDYPALEGPKAGNFSQNITFIKDSSTFPMEFYSAIFQDRMNETFTGIKQIGEDFLTTAEGQDYMRWEIEYTREGAVLHQTIYFFGSGDWVYVITYTRLGSQGSQNDSLVDETMKTVVFPQ